MYAIVHEEWEDTVLWHHTYTRRGTCRGRKAIIKREQISAPSCLEFTQIGFLLKDVIIRVRRCIKIKCPWEKARYRLFIMLKCVIRSLWVKIGLNRFSLVTKTEMKKWNQDLFKELDGTWTGQKGACVGRAVCYFKRHWSVFRSCFQEGTARVLTGGTSKVRLWFEVFAMPL